MSKKMTRTEKLYSMKGPELIKYAESIGVKLPTNKAGTALKIAKDEAITRIIDAENRAAGAPAPAEETVKLVLTGEEPMVDCTQTDDIIEEPAVDTEEPDAEPKVKKERKAVEKVSFEGLLARIPALVSNIVYKRLKGDRVGIMSNKRRLLAVGAGRGGYRIITNKADLANLFSDDLGLSGNMTADGRDFVYSAITQEQMEQMVKAAVHC